MMIKYSIFTGFLTPLIMKEVLHLLKELIRAPNGDEKI